MDGHQSTVYCLVILCGKDLPFKSYCKEHGFNVSTFLEIACYFKQLLLEIVNNFLELACLSKLFVLQFFFAFGNRDSICARMRTEIYVCEDQENRSVKI